MNPEDQFYQRLHALTSTANQHQQQQVQTVNNIDIYSLIERLRQYFAGPQPQPQAQEDYGYWRQNG